MNHLQTAWNEHQKMTFPVSIQFYHSAPANEDKNIQLGIVYAAGCIQSFITQGLLNEDMRQCLVWSKEEIQSCLDIQDEAGRAYLEILNDICGAVLDALGHQDGVVPSSPPAAQRPED